MGLSTPEFQGCVGRRGNCGEEKPHEPAQELCQDAKSEGVGLSGMALLPHPVAQRSEEWLEESGYPKLPCRAGSDTPAGLF